MADYLPRFKPGEAITSQASAAITGGRLVAVSGDGTVATAAANSASVVGVAAFDVAASGDKVTIYRGGVQKLVASGVITAGDQVVADTGGKVKSLAAAGVLADLAAASTAINNARQVIGTAQTTTAADGDIVDVVWEG